MVGLWQPLTAACLQDVPCLLAGKACNNINNNIKECACLELVEGGLGALGGRLFARAEHERAD